MTQTPLSPNQNRQSPLQQPDSLGRFGKFGGKYVPETLMPALLELEAAYYQHTQDPEFQQQLNELLRDYVGRPSPLYFAERLTAHYARPDGTGAQIYLKREDLNHTGAHKINNALAQVLLAKRMGKQRVIAETGAGQHGVATATVCARFGLDCASGGSRNRNTQGCDFGSNSRLGDECGDYTLYPRFGRWTTSLSDDRP